MITLIKNFSSEEVLKMAGSITDIVNKIFHFYSETGHLSSSRNNTKITKDLAFIRKLGTIRNFKTAKEVKKLTKEII